MSKTIVDTKQQKKIIIIGNGFKNSISDNLFRDVINNEIDNVEYYYIWDIKNSFVSFLQKRYYSRKWNLYKKIPFFKWIFKRYNAFERIKRVIPVCLDNVLVRYLEI